MRNSIKLLAVLLLALTVQNCYAESADISKTNDNMYVWYVYNPQIDANILKRHLNASKNKQKGLKIQPQVCAVAFAADFNEQETENLPVFKDMSDGSILILDIE